MLHQPKGVQTVRVLHNNNLEISFKEAHKNCVGRRDYLKNKLYFFDGGIDNGLSNYESSETASHVLLFRYHFRSNTLLRLVLRVPYSARAAALENCLSPNKQPSHGYGWCYVLGCRAGWLRIYYFNDGLFHTARLLHNCPAFQSGGGISIAILPPNLCVHLQHSPSLLIFVKLFTCIYTQRML
jgi:hypothetical protein